MFSKKIEKAFNEQINAEIHSYYLYLSMSAWFTSKGYDGMASWMKLQAQEEMVHAMKFFDHINERGGTVKLTTIEGPKTTFKSPLEIYKAALEHEEYITDRIHKLYKMATVEDDYASQSFLQWFVDEQVEEEATAQAVVDQLNMVKDHPGGLFMMDRELGKRQAGGGE